MSSRRCYCCSINNTNRYIDNVSNLVNIRNCRNRPIDNVINRINNNANMSRRLNHINNRTDNINTLYNTENQYIIDNFQNHYNETNINEILNNSSTNLESTKLDSSSYSLPLFKSNIPELFLDPITFNIMKNPVITPKGITYEESSIKIWLQIKKKCPLTKTHLKPESLIPNRILKDIIENWINTNKVSNL